MGFKNCCYICGEKNFIQRHHIIPRAKGGSDDPSNIIRLCPNCHVATHHNLYSEDELFKLKETREIKGVEAPKKNNQLTASPLELHFPNLDLQALSALESLRKISPVDRLMK